MFKKILLEDFSKVKTYFKNIFFDLQNFQMDYNWLITNVDTCFPFNEENKHIFDNKYLWITGSALTKLVNEDNFQWVFAKLQGYEKNINLEDILKYGIPSTNYNEYMISNELVSMEIDIIDGFIIIFTINDSSKLYNRIFDRYPLSVLLENDEVFHGNYKNTKKKKGKFIPLCMYGNEYYINGVNVFNNITNDAFLKYIVVRYNRRNYQCKLYEIKGVSAIFQLAVMNISKYISIGFLIRNIDINKVYYSKKSKYVLKNDNHRNNSIRKKVFKQFLSDHPTDFNENNYEDIIYSESFDLRCGIKKINNAFHLNYETIENFEEMSFPYDIRDIFSFPIFRSNGNISITESLSNAIKLANEYLNKNGNSKNKNLTIDYMKRLNELLLNDGFKESFIFDSSKIIENIECYILKITNPIEEDKTISLCILDYPDLSFLDNFYDDYDLNLTDNFDNNVKKIYDLLKPILKNEIISVTSKEFGGIFTKEQYKISKEKNYFWENYKNVKIQIWNGKLEDN